MGAKVNLFFCLRTSSACSFPSSMACAYYVRRRCIFIFSTMCAGQHAANRVCDLDPLLVGKMNIFFFFLA